jgi:hypothetical protein
MPRITCDQPGYKPVAVRGFDLAATATAIAEAPDFSIPDPNDAASQVVVAGEIWFGSPVYLYNKTEDTREVSVEVLTEDDDTIALGVISIPAGDTVAFPLQGQSLMKRDPDATNGDRLRLTADAADAIDYWATAYERRADDHIGVV